MVILLQYQVVLLDLRQVVVLVVLALLLVLLSQTIRVDVHRIQLLLKDLALVLDELVLLLLFPMMLKSWQVVSVDYTCNPFLVCVVRSLNFQVDIVRKTNA